MKNLKKVKNNLLSLFWPLLNLNIIIKLCDFVSTLLGTNGSIKSNIIQIDLSYTIKADSLQKVLLSKRELITLILSLLMLNDYN